MTTNPYAPPAFSPAFGAFLHMLNWRALGESARASSAKSWFIASLVMLGVYVALGFAVPDPKAADGAARGVGLAYLFVWYFSAARGQARYVREKFGKTYPRRGWGKPLLIAVAAVIGYIALAVAIGFLFGVAGQA